jgi:hypothetical protein
MYGATSFRLAWRGCNIHATASGGLAWHVRVLGRMRCTLVFLSMAAHVDPKRDRNRLAASSSFPCSRSPTAVDTNWGLKSKCLMVSSSLIT